MSTKSQPWWLKVDFAGKHGTIWGALNLWLTTITTTTLERVLGHCPWYVAAGTAIGGFVLTLGWAALRKQATPPGTVLYQLGCWAGAGVWAAWMLASGPWSWGDWFSGISILAGATLVAGLTLALGREHHPVDQAPAAAPTMAAPEQGDGMTQGERNTLGAIWQERIDRLSNNAEPPPPVAKPGKPLPPPVPWTSRIKPEALRQWPRGAGHTLEGVFTSGSWGMPQLRALCETLSAEADLPYGCHVTAVEPAGAGRRAFHLKVNTKNMLLEPQPFPADGGPWTTDGGTPIGCEQTGDMHGLFHREKNVAIFAAPGGGKTGGTQAATASLALTADEITVGIDAAGGQLINNANNAYDTGRAKHPVFAAVARTYTEAERLARALVRINHVRKSPVYDYLKRRENVTLLPIGATVLRSELAPAAQKHFPDPADVKRIVSQIVCICDEPREFTSVNGSQAVTRQWIGTGMREARDGGVRYLFGLLGTSDANIMQSLQNLIHTNIAGVLATDGEYAGAFGHASGVKASSFPQKPNGKGKVPGIMFISDDPGTKPVQFRFYGEMTPAIMDQVAIRASEIGTLPDLDYVSELAANGFLPDGTPWPVKKGSEMEECDRWYWRDRNANRPAPQSPAAPEPIAPPAEGGMDALRAKVASMEQTIERRTGELMQAEPDVDDEQLARIVDEWIAGAEQAVPAADEPWRDRVLRTIREAGAEGIQMKDLLKIAGVDRSEVYKFLRPLVQATKLWQPTPGFYAFPADDL